MSDETATPETGEQESTQSAAEPTPKPTETVDFWKSKAREQEKRAKENADAAKRLADIEESQKTEEQKAAERIRVAEERAAELEWRANAAEAAAEARIPVDALLGPKERTPEGLREFASLLQSLIADAGKPRSPQPDPNQGQAGSQGGSPEDQFIAWASRP